MRRYALLAIALAGCGESVTETPLDPLAVAQLDIVSGADQVDTIEARLAPITVQLVTAVTGADMSGQLVNFRVVEEGCGDVWAGSSLTDANGQAADLWDLGTKPGLCHLEARVVDADGTPRVLAQTTATVEPGRAASLRILPNRVRVFVGATLDLDTLPREVEDRRGNQVTDAPRWTARDPIGLDESLVSFGDEAGAWVVGDVGEARDSVEVWVLHDLIALGTTWYRELRTRYHAGTSGTHAGCDGNPFSTSADDMVDSTRSVTRFVDVTYHPTLGLRPGDGDHSFITWCRNGAEIESVGTSAVSTMEHWPGRLGLLFADGPLGHYSRVTGSDTEEPFRTNEERFYPGN